jgi:hypothetical protein
MRPAPAATTIKVTKETKEKLKTWKDQVGAPSMDALFQCMDIEVDVQGAAAAASADEGDDSGEPVKKRRVGVREPLYSHEILRKRPGMLEYYTGFDLSAVNLLITRFREVRLEHNVFFSFLFALPCALFSVCLPIHLKHLFQVIDSDAPRRRESNEGFRKLDLEERVVMFLSRLKRKVTFKELGYQYGCGEESAR